MYILKVPIILDLARITTKIQEMPDTIVEEDAFIFQGKNKKEMNSLIKKIQEFWYKPQENFFPQTGIFSVEIKPLSNKVYDRLIRLYGKNVIPHHLNKIRGGGEARLWNMDNLDTVVGQVEYIPTMFRHLSINLHRAITNIREDKEVESVIKEIDDIATRCIGIHLCEEDGFYTHIHIHNNNASYKGIFPYSFNLPWSKEWKADFSNSGFGDVWYSVFNNNMNPYPTGKIMKEGYEALIKLDDLISDGRYIITGEVKDEIEKFSISPADVKVPYTFYKSDVPEKPLNPNNRCLFEDIRRFIGDF